MNKRPTLKQLKDIGLYLHECDPVHVAELKAEYDDLKSHADFGRYYYECDPSGFYRSLEIISE
jgi:hypothetical protein